MKQKLLSTVLACALIISCALPISTLAAKTFSDTKGHWAASYITKGVEHGYINGYENGQFRPNNSVSRAEFCKMMNNALGLKNVVTLDFSDVKSSNWFYSEVAKSVGAGYISGYEDGTFRANNQITRQEAAVVISRIVADPSQKKDLSGLKDAASIESWAKSGTQSVYSKGYMAGDNKKNFNPKGNLTRAEAVKTIESILDGESFTKNDLSITTANQTVSNTVYTGNVTVRGTGSATFTNCRILGKLELPEDATLRLQDSKVGTLTLSSTGSTSQVITAGSSEVLTTNLSGGTTLTESGLTGSGFRNLVFSGTALKSQPVYLTGNFEKVTVDSPSNMYLRSGGISTLKMNKSASGSRVDLFAGTTVNKAELFVPTTFTGKGVITLAVQNVLGSTFETPPLTLQGQSNNVLVPIVKPSNGSTNISTDTNIDITFSDITYTSNTALVTTNYVENNVFELRRDSETGSTVGYSTTLSNNNRNYSLKPATLSGNTKYYLIFKAGSLKNAQGGTNSRQVFSFTTSGQSVRKVTPYPADGATSIPVNSTLRFTFDEAVYQPNGSTSLTPSYLKNSAIELRSGSTGGRTIGFTADISSDRRTVTLNPDSNLSTSTTYYMILKSGTIANSNGNTYPYQSYSFTTASSSILVPIMTPSPGSTSVSPSADLLLEFDTALYTSAGNSYISSTYLQDTVFQLKQDSTSGSTVDCTATISNDRRTVTISPRNTLKNDKTYYLTLFKDSLCDASGSSRRYNDKLVLSFTVGNSTQSGDLAPTMSPKHTSTGSSTGTDITLTFDSAIYQTGSAMSEITSSYLKNDVIQLRSGSASGSTVPFTATINYNNRVVTISPNSKLSNNTRYYVIVNANTIQNSNRLQNDKFTAYFTCGTALSYLAPTVTPADGATGVSTNDNITVNFSERIYDKNGGNIDNTTTSRNYLGRNAFELHQDRESGGTVGFTVDMVSSNRNITIIPNSLTAGKTYYLILLEGQVQDGSGRSNERQVFSFTVGSGLSVTTSPSNGASGVSRTSSIALTFGDRLYTTGGSQLTSSNVYNQLSSAISLYGGGDYPGFSLDMSYNGRTIYITPDRALQPNRTYTVTLSAGRISDGGTATNNSLTFSFTTENNQLVPSISPTNGASSQPVNTTVTLTFSDTLYKPNSSSLLSTADVGTNIVELREGSSTGDVIACTATVSNNRVISLKPNVDLKYNTTYYVLLKQNSLANSNNTSGSNAAQTYYFTTAAQPSLTASTATISAWDRASNEQTLTLGFNGADLKAMDQTSILNALTISTTSGAKPTIKSARISGKNVILTTDTFIPGASYTVSAGANVFTDSSERKNQAFTQSATAPALNVTLAVPEIKKESAKIAVTYNYPIKMTLTIKNTDDNVERTIISNASPKESPYTVTEAVLPGKNYTVIVTGTVLGQSTPFTQQQTFKTDRISDVCTLSDLVVDAKDLEYHPLTGTETTASITVLPYENKTVKVKPILSDTNSTMVVSIAGTTATAGADGYYEVSLDTAPVTVTIVVTAENITSTKTYTLTLTPKTT